MDASITFHPYSLAHALVVVTFILVTVLVVLVGINLTHPQRRKLDAALAIACAVAWAIINGWWLRPGNFDPAVSLPLHVCDLTALITPFVLLWPARTLRALLYFWGLGLSVQGFIQPDLRDGPAKPGFWFFWANHYIVVGIAIYDLVARGYRPRWRDYAIAVGAGFVYLGLVMPINVVWGFNYGYLGPSMPNQPTIIDYLGPWPWRVPIMSALTAAVMALMVLPWQLARKVERLTIDA